MIDIYLIANKINGKVYVGKTQIGYKKRFGQHCRAYNYGNRTYISCAIHKYGKENFELKLLGQVEDDSWEFWEKFYIQKYKSLYTQNGYNITEGGDSNPMDSEEAIQKHNKVCKSEYFRNLQRQIQLGRHHSEETKELCRKNTLSNLDVCLAGFRKYNESKKIKIAAIQNDKIIKVFDSLSEASAYACEVNNKTLNPGNASHILQYADKYNKNGKRAKYLGFAWTQKI